MDLMDGENYGFYLIQTYLGLKESNNEAGIDDPTLLDHSKLTEVNNVK